MFYLFQGFFTANVLLVSHDSTQITVTSYDLAKKWQGSSGESPPQMVAFFQEQKEVGEIF